MKGINLINKNLIVLCMGLSFLLIQSPLFAQAPPPIPTAAEEEEAFLKKKPYEELKRKPKVEIKREDEEVLAPPLESKKKFFIKKITIVGNTILSPKSIKKIVREYENKVLTLDDLMGLAQKITALYASKGYVTSQAYVPPQKVKDETVIIKVMEGEYGKFDIEGARHTRKSIVEKRLKKKPGAILDYNELRKDLLYLNENPDRTVKATMLRGEEPRTTDLEITVKDRSPVHVGYTINNVGNKSTGLWQNTYSLRDTGLFRYDDDLNIRVVHSNTGNLRGIAGDYTVPVNEFGTKLGAALSYFVVNINRNYLSNIDPAYAGWDIESTATTCSFYMRHPVFDFNWLSGQVDAGLDLKEARTEIQKVEESHDRLRIMKAGLTVEESDRWGRSVLRNELNMAPSNFLGSFAEDNDAPDHPDSANFLKYNFVFSRMNRLPFSAALLLNLEGQATNNPLFGSEQKRIGGAYTVRGYPEGEALGDYGINGSAEVRFPFYFIPKDFNIYGINPRRTVQGVGFVDWGFVRPVSSSESGRSDENLAGTGFGLRVDFLKCISGRLDVAWPVGEPSTFGRKPMVHVLFSIKEPTLEESEEIHEEMMQNRIRSKLNTMAKDVPADVIDSYEKALGLEKEGRYKEARSLFISVISRKNVIIDEAKAKIDNAIEKEEKAEAYLEEAGILYKNGAYMRAKKVYEKILLLKQGEII